MLHASLKKKTKKMNIKHRPKSLRLSGLTDVCGKVSVYTSNVSETFSNLLWVRLSLSFRLLLILVGCILLIPSFREDYDINTVDFSHGDWLYLVSRLILLGFGEDEVQVNFCDGLTSIVTMNEMTLADGWIG